MGKALLASGALALVIGFLAFFSWTLGFDIQSNRPSFAEFVDGTTYYFTCDGWEYSPFGNSPCLNGHTQGWDLIPIALMASGSGLIIYSFISMTDNRNKQVLSR